MKRKLSAFLLSMAMLLMIFASTIQGLAADIIDAQISSYDENQVLLYSVLLAIDEAFMIPEDKETTSEVSKREAAFFIFCYAGMKEEKIGSEEDCDALVKSIGLAEGMSYEAEELSLILCLEMERRSMNLRIRELA